MSFPTVEIRRLPSMALFAVFAMAMVIGSYLFVLILAAACVLLPYLFLTHAESVNVQILILFLFGMVIAGTLLWSLIPRRDKFERPGMLLDRKAHPRLFTELESIADALNQPLPREVYLIGAPNPSSPIAVASWGWAAAAFWDWGCPWFLCSRFRNSALSSPTNSRTISAATPVSDPGCTKPRARWCASSKT